MIGRSSRAIVLACVAGGTSACYAFVGRYGDSFYRPPDGQPETAPEPHYFEKVVDQAVRSSAEEPRLVPLVAGDSDLHVQGESERRCLEQPVLFRFAWLSDVQLRQREVKLFSEEISRAGDDIIDSFEHDPAQEEFSWAAFLAQVLAVNGLVEDAVAANDLPGAPMFTIHTGDSLDAGTVEEAYQFVEIANHVRTPWLNALGNHDTAIYGNYEKRMTYSRDSDAEFYPVGRRGFLGMHRSRGMDGFGSRLLPVPPNAAHFASLDGAIDLAGLNTQLEFYPTIRPTKCHGFDLHAPSDAPSIVAAAPSSDTAPGCADAPGHYSFRFERGGLSFRAIVLDTTKRRGWGAESSFPDSERAFLEGELASARGDDAILLFAHHRPSPGVVDAIRRSGTAPRVVWFSGHTHQHHVVRASAEQPFPELNTGSILEYPQVGRVVEMRGEKGGLCVVSRVLWTSYQGATARDLDSSRWTPRELDEQLEPCVHDPVPLRASLARASRCAFLGAIRDRQQAERRVIRNEQPFEQWWKEANVVVRLTGEGTP